MIVCTPSPIVWPLLLLHMTMLAAEGLLLTALARNGRIWSEIYGPTLRYLWRELGALRRLRSHVQRSRRAGVRDYFSVTTLPPRKLLLLWRHRLPTFQ